MSIDRFPKKACKFCAGMGHFSYQCYKSPKKAMDRTPIKKVGKYTKQWFVTRDTWIRKHPAPIQGTWWICYLRIHPYCPGRMTIKELTLDHVVSRSRDPSMRFSDSNLMPCCKWCNNKKGSKSLEQVKPPMVD